MVTPEQIYGLIKSILNTNNLQLYGIKYSYQIQIICTQLYGLKYSYLILSIIWS